MTLRNQRPLTFRPASVTDAVDGTNGAAGSLAAAVNLVPSMHTRNVWVPRPAITPSFSFPPSYGEGEALVEIGDRVWGFVQRGDGVSLPFCYDYSTNSFVNLQGTADAFLPASTSNSGDWQPPSIAQVGAYLIFTHPGFGSQPNLWGSMQLGTSSWGAHPTIAFGWIDQTGFTDLTFGDVAVNSPTIHNLQKDVLLGGWRPGMTIAGANIPAGTRINSVAIDGLSLTMTASATGTASGRVVAVAGGTPDAPLWCAGNANMYPLIGVPQWVSMFNGRAWYAVNNAAVWSDAGDPLQITNADQALTIQNGLPITCMSPMPFANQTLQGGVTSALMVFQGDAALWQITGDQVTQNLALNYTASNGTLAPNTLATVPMAGLRFIAPDGLRQIGLNGVLSEPLADRGDGVALPMVNAPFPSRMCAAYNEDVYRVSVSGYTTVGGAPMPMLASGEFFFHEKLKAWSGPHSCPARLITPSDREHTQHGFLLFELPPVQPVLGSGATWMLATGVAGVIALGTGGVAQKPATTVCFSNTHPMIDSSYSEHGQQLTWVLQTSLLPDTGDMFIAAMLETAVMLAIPPGGTINVTALDERGATISDADIAGFFLPASQLPPNTWADMNVPPAALIWGQGKWATDTSAGTRIVQRQVDWRATLVFKQTSLVLRGESSNRIAVGNIYMRYQRSGYMLVDPARITPLPAGIPNFAA